MTSLQDIIQLCNDDNSKAFVINESGDVKLVIMGTGEYHRLLLGKLKQRVQDVEEINRRILEAQLQEPELVKPIIGTPKDLSVNNNSAMTAAESLAMKPKRVDMRSEVIDPNFDFDSEAIKPDFDDI